MKRAKIITFICIIGYLSVLFTFPQVFSPQIKKLGIYVPAIYGVLVAINFISYVGLWYFKQWGLLLYLVSHFSKLLFYLIVSDLGFSFYINLVPFIIFSIILVRYYPKMDPNL